MNNCLCFYVSLLNFVKLQFLNILYILEVFHMFYFKYVDNSEFFKYQRIRIK